MKYLAESLLVAGFTSLCIGVFFQYNLPMLGIVAGVYLTLLAVLMASSRN